jgi:hypothetical protein
MKRLIRKILREEFNYKEKIFNLLNSGQDENIEMVKYLSEGQGYDLIDLLFGYFKEYGPPYFNIFNVLELTEEEQEFILTKIYGYITIKGRNSLVIRIYEYNGNQIYLEHSDGDWSKWEYDDKGDRIYREDSDGDWVKYEYDDKGNMIYSEDSDDYWEKYEYDDKGNRVYEERSNGYWEIQKYDDKGYRIYYESSDGYIEDNR